MIKVFCHSLRHVWICRTKYVIGFQPCEAQLAMMTNYYNSTLPRIVFVFSWKLRISMSCVSCANFFLQTLEQLLITLIAHCYPIKLKFCILFPMKHKFAKLRQATTTHFASYFCQAGINCKKWLIGVRKKNCNTKLSSQINLG